MNSYSEYYETKLYPLQDGVLRCVEGCNEGFFLTGGTALSRGYCNHRYSDDLYFFVCSDNQFTEKVVRILRALTTAGFEFPAAMNFIRTADFTSVYVQRHQATDIRLKIDFVNDVAPHFGDVIPTPLFSRTDSLRNILSNKLSALFRLEGKDVADIYMICKIFPFEWESIIEETRLKEAGFEVPLAAEILLGIPKDEFMAVKWKVIPRWDEFLEGLQRITRDMVQGKENSLAA